MAMTDANLEQALVIDNTDAMSLNGPVVAGD